MNRRGFALIAVLWLITVAAGIVGAGVLAVRLGQHARTNRISLTRARWAAEACLHIAQARWREERFRAFEKIVLTHGLSCRMSAEDPGARLNVNAADSTALWKVVRALHSDSAAAAQWLAVALGIRDRGLVTDLMQLSRLRGFEPSLARYLTVDGPGSINTLSAEPHVLRALPGLTEEAVRLLVARRAHGVPIQDLDELSGELSGPARTALTERYGELTQTLRFDTTHLLLLAEGRDVSTGVALRASVEVLVAVVPERLAVLRRRVR